MTLWGGSSRRWVVLLESPDTIALPSGSVDTVLLTSAPHCMAVNLCDYLAETVRVLQPTGRVVIVEDTFCDCVVPVVCDDKPVPPGFRELFHDLEPVRRIQFLRFAHWFTAAAPEGRWSDDSLVTSGQFLAMEEWIDLAERAGFVMVGLQYLLGFFDRPAGLMAFELK
jgi:hypothetical protein